MTGRLISVSGIVVDLVYRVEEVPKPGTEAAVRGFSMAAGGGFNAMAAARRMGAEVIYAGTLGTGPFADIAAAALEVEGIEALRPRLPNQDQGVCTVLVDRDGERAFAAASGADGVVSDADLELVKPEPEDWLLLSGYAIHYPGSRDALGRWLASCPPRLVLDPSPVIAEISAELRKLVLQAARWITANRQEGEALTGLADPGSIAESLAEERPEGGGAVLRDGERGCHLAMPGEEARHVPGYPVESVDTNGAGDAHTGAFIAMLARGETPLRAAQLANVCAALSTTRAGPATAPPLETVLAAMERTPEAAGSERNRVQRQGRNP